MSPRNWQDRIRDILDAIAEIQKFTYGMDLESFKEDDKAIRAVEMNFIIICCGGGGIPVIRAGRSFSGVDAVIDKDLASAKLAQEVGVDIFLIASDVEGVALNYGKKDQKFLRRSRPLYIFSTYCV